MTKDYGDGHIRWTSGPGRGGRFAPKAQTAGSVGAESHRQGRGRAAADSSRVAVAAGAGPVKPIAPSRLRRASVDQLHRWFHEISQRPTGTEGVDAGLTAIFDELGRREGAPVAVRDDHRSRQVDEFTTGGMNYLDAYAEVHHLDVRELESQERMQLVERERRPGESRAKTIRRMYAEHVAMAVLQAEEETNGRLLSKEGLAENNRRRRKGNFGIDPASLWYGNPKAARKYASDELKAWWAAHGGRPTAAGWAAQFTGDRKAAERARMAGQGRDFGV